jgi:hypothetical protein
MRREGVMTKEYLEYQEKCSFKIGDKVLLESIAGDFQDGWDNTFEEEMKEALGKTGTVEGVYGGRGVGVVFDEGDGGVDYSYPAFCLKKIVRENELFWICKYCGENEKPRCPQCVREDGKNVTDELVRD